MFHFTFLFSVNPLHIIFNQVISLGYIRYLQVGLGKIMGTRQAEICEKQIQLMLSLF